MQQYNLCLSCMEKKGVAKTCPHCGWVEGSAPESALHLPPGTVLQEKYLMGRALGQGGFGITYLAYDTTLNIKLAIKEYMPQQLATRTGGERTVTVFKKSLAEEFNYGMNKFLEEARTLARFNEHPNIVTVRDYFEANNTAYLVMNYHEGVTLQSYLESKGGKIEVEQALNIFMPVLDALKEVHAAGILHRDISPDNLLIDTRGRVVLIDFGAARQAMGEKSRSMSVIMKAGYSPEEQYRSKGEQGPWTDIYAVAATFYQAITGQIPPESLDRLAEETLIPPSELGVRIDPQQEEALLKAIAVRSKERHRAVGEFLEALLHKDAKKKTEIKYAVIKTLEKEEIGIKSFDTGENKSEKRFFFESGRKTKFGLGALLALVLFLFGVMSLFITELDEKILGKGDEKPKSGLAFQNYNNFACNDEVPLGDEQVDKFTPMIEDNGIYVIALPDEEIKVTSKLAYHHLIYAVKSGYKTTVIKRDIRDGTESILFEFNEFVKAEHVGNYWKGLPPSVDLSTDKRNLAFIDNEGLKVYDLQRKSVETFLQIVIEGDLYDDFRPAVWSEEVMNKDGWVIIANPSWSSDGNYIVFEKGAHTYYGFSSLVNINTGEISHIKGIVSSLDLVWSQKENTFISATQSYETSPLFISSSQDISEAKDLSPKIGLPERTDFHKANFSMDGDKIAFIFSKSDSPKTKNLAIANKDGLDYRLIAEDVLDIIPFFSCDDNSIYFFIEKDEVIILVNYDLLEQKSIEYIKMPFSLNCWRDPYWTEEGFLVLVGVSESSPGSYAGEKNRLFVLDMDNKYVIYATSLMEGFVTFAGFMN